MYSKTNKIINNTTDFSENMSPCCNKARTACTVTACKAPKSNADCIIM